MPVRLAAALLLTLLCSPAGAADPWTPFRKAFPGPREPVVATPLPPVLPPELPPPPVIMLPEPEPPPVDIDPPAVVPLPPVRDVRSSSKPRTKAPLSLAPKPRQPKTPEENDGSWLAPCSWVCGHVRGKSKSELDVDEVYWRVTAYQKAHGQRCIVSTCPLYVPPEVLKEMQQKVRG